MMRSLKILMIVRLKSIKNKIAYQKTLGSLNLVKTQIEVMELKSVNHYKKLNLLLEEQQRVIEHT
jgi:hypothetical protein